MLDKLARYQGDNIRALATVHLSEALVTSKYENSTDGNSHQWMDKNGWEYRKVYLQSPSGGIYEAMLNIAVGDTRNILYDINNIRKIDKIRGSDGVVPSTESGRGSHITRSSTENIADANDNVNTEKSNSEHTTTGDSQHSRYQESGVGRTQSVASGESIATEDDVVNTETGNFSDEVNRQFQQMFSLEEDAPAGRKLTAEEIAAAESQLASERRGWDEMWLRNQYGDEGYQQILEHRRQQEDARKKEAADKAKAKQAEKKSQRAERTKKANAKADEVAAKRKADSQAPTIANHCRILLG